MLDEAGVFYSHEKAVSICLYTLLLWKLLMRYCKPVFSVDDLLCSRYGFFSTAVVYDLNSLHSTGRDLLDCSKHVLKNVHEDLRCNILLHKLYF